MTTTTETTIPTRCDVVVIGGGPAGSGISSLLAKNGYDVVVLEKEKFPRNQVGESILPQMWKFADMFGVSEKLEAEKFLAKSGGIIVWNGRIQQVKFSNFGYDPTRMGLHVERDIFDDILLRNSEEKGARVYEEVAFREADFSDEAWPVVRYVDRRDNTYEPGAITCRYVVDASGNAAVLARQFGTLRLVGNKKTYLGLWGYYRDSLYMGVDQQAHPVSEAYDIKPVTFVCNYNDGWIWHIVLRESTSVGMVVNTRDIKGMGKDAQQAYLQETCASVPYLRDLLAPAEFIEGSMRFRPDYSYYSESVTGDNFYCIGDAGGFVDPIFSQGVQAAFFNAAVSAWAIDASMRNFNRRRAYSKMAEKQIMQYYGFSRLLALGDFGEEGVDPDYVKAMMRTLPENELELTLAAATTTDRSGNLQRMIREAGLLEELGEDFGHDKVAILPTLGV